MSLLVFLAFPAFVFALFVFYWSLSLGALFFQVRVTQLEGKRNDVLAWGNFLRQFFGVKIVISGEHNLYKGGRCLYLANHRSWSDFFLDAYLTEGRAALMSRWMVFFAFPFFVTSSVFLKSVVLFKRGTILDKEKFNAWLDDKLQNSWVPGFLVYPEGHRSTRPTSLPLKRGMLNYGYSRKLPVQLVISKNKEAVLSEKQMLAHFGVTVVTGYSKVIESQAHADFESFAAEVQREWDSLWQQVFSADPTELPLLKDTEPVMFDYPQETKMVQLAATAFGVLVMLLSLYFTWRTVATVLLIFGPLQQVLSILIAMWIAVSMFLSFQPPGVLHVKQA